MQCHRKNFQWAPAVASGWGFVFVEWGGRGYLGAHRTAGPSGRAAVARLAVDPMLEINEPNASAASNHKTRNFTGTEKLPKLRFSERSSALRVLWGYQDGRVHGRILCPETKRRATRPPETARGRPLNDAGGRLSPEWQRGSHLVLRPSFKAIFES